MTEQRPATPTSPIGFAELGVPRELVSALAAQGIESAFPIQSATLPDTLAGRDVLGRGRTGSGKTVAFAIPALCALSRSGRRPGRGAPRALILVPTRELAAQVAAAVEPLAASLGLSTMTIFGGVSQRPQVNKLRSGTDICIATPGRLEDLIEQRECNLSSIEVTVLDEADHMADLGFLPAVKRILDLTPRNTQRLLFSATLDNGIDVLVRRYLNKPLTHSVDSAASHVPDMEHHAFVVTRDHKAAVVRGLVAGQGRTLAFTRTKGGAKALARKLTAAGIPAVDLHGDLSQRVRQRNLAAFGAGDVRVLVATDIAARGIHVDDVSLVVHVDPPSEHKAYLHRSGRTARAGAKGRVVTVATNDQSRDVRRLMKRASINPLIASVTPESPEIEKLVGPQADYVDPATVVQRQPTDTSGGNRRYNGRRRGGPAAGRSQSGPRGGQGSGRGRGRRGNTSRGTAAGSGRRG